MKGAHEEEDEHQGERTKVPYEVFMIVGAHAVGDPRTMMIETGHTPIAQRTVLRAQWLAHQARVAKPARIEAFVLGQVDDGLRTDD